MVKVLHVYKDFDPPVRGGIEGHMARMCHYQHQWAEVEALTCSRAWRGRVVERAGTRVTEAGEWGRFLSTPVSPLFPWHMRTSKADVLVVHVPHPTAELGWLLARPDAALVVRYHSDVVRQAAAMKVYRPLFMKFLRKADIILATSPQYVESSAVLREMPERCRVVPLGIVPEDFAAPPHDRIAEVQRRYGGPYVFFCGRHRYYKGLRYLVEAAATIDAPVVIAGDGPERAACMEQAGKSGGRVHFPGDLSHDQLVAHLHGAELFVFPSVERSEAFGLSILEAHACGKAVVATTLGTGVEFANLDGQTGLNVPPRKARLLAEAVNALLADPARRRRMGECGRERVRTELNAATVARREFEIYEEVLASRRR